MICKVINIVSSLNKNNLHVKRKEYSYTERVHLRQGNALVLESNDLELYIFSQEDPTEIQPHLQEDQPVI